MEQVIRSIAAVGTVAVGVAVMGHATGVLDRVGNARGASLLQPAVAATQDAGSPVAADTTGHGETSLSPEQLAEVIDTTNHRVFDTQAPDATAPAPAYSVEADPASVDAEFHRLDLIDQAMGLDTPAVQDTVVTVEGTEPTAGGRVVTLHVTRTLPSGTQWEELMPYLVVDDAGTGVPVGTFRALDTDGEAPQEQAERMLDSLR